MPIVVTPDPIVSSKLSRIAAQGAFLDFSLREFLENLGYGEQNDHATELSPQIRLAHSHIKK